MATTPSSTAGPSTSSPYERVIHKQLGSTRRQLKLVDLFAAVMSWGAAVLGFLLLVSLIDHWVAGLGLVGRSLSFLVIMGGTVWYAATQIAPLLARRINPIYAARSIEEGAPEIKNSLVNYLTLRKRPGQLRQPVLDALGERAATDLQRSSPETSVDRTKLIRTGYVLAGVLTVCCLYRILSPKNPLTTVSRVLMPWSSVQRPSRVEVASVSPGDAEVLRGRTVQLSARIRGSLRRGEEVQVVLNSADGQIRDRVLAMTEKGGAWQLTVPPGPRGMQQDVTYRVEAGDGVSATYRLTVLPVPTILVREVTYDPPDYTQRPPRTTTTGDLSGLEGTLVTIRAEASHEIGSALLELNPDPDGRPARTVNMQADGRTATANLRLELRPDGRPVYERYQLTFVSQRGHPSEAPVVHAIEVLSDLAPVVEILTPQRTEIEVPENGAAQFEVRALDPDFGLTRVTLRGVAGGQEVLQETREKDNLLGQVVETFTLAPQQLGLRAGDELVCRASAADNRWAADGSEPQPNVSQTDEYRVKITPPQKGPQDQQRGAAGERPKDDPANEDPQRGQEPREQREEPGQGEQSEQGEQSGDKDGGSSEDQAEQGEQAESTEGDAGQTGGAEGDQQGQQTGGQQDQGATAGSDSATQKTGSGGAGEQQGSSGSTGNTGAQQPQPGGQRGQGNSSAGQGNQQGQAPGTADEPLHDGEVFERIQERLEKKFGGQGQPRTPDAQPSDGEQGQSGSGSQGVDDQAPGADSGEASSTPTKLDPQPGDSRGGNKPEGQQQPSGEGLERDLGQGKSAGVEPGEGGNPQGPTEANPEQADPDRKRAPQSNPGQGDNGDFGPAGPQNQTPDGAPASQDQNADTDKDTKPKEGTSDDLIDSPPAPSQDRKQRDIEGGEAGDRSGGGGKGGGQGGQREGNDSAGTHSAADQGGGAAPESGQGETARRSGDKQTAEGPTGQSGAEAGPGSSQRDNPQGQQSGGPASPSAADQQKRDPNPRTASGQRQAGGAGDVTGGGLPSDNEGGPTSPQQPVRPPRDKANLDYARQATDMVLEYLEEQQQRPDPELLDELNWNEQELAKFLARWKKMRAAADSSPKARRELDDALRGLGLAPPETRTRTMRESGDNLQRVIDSGSRSEPPPQYRQKFNAFRQR